MSKQDDEYLKKVLIFVDRNGTVEDKSSSSHSASLKMKYEENGLHIEMYVCANGMGNGSCGATIKYRENIVYEAKGNYTSGPFNTEVTKYSTGVWESLISR